MQLRRFEAATVTEALAQVRATLGSEAVILHSRAADPVAVGRPRHGWVEVTAAVDDTPVEPGDPAPREDYARSAADRREPGRAHAPWSGRPSVEAIEPGSPERLEEMYRILLDLRAVDGPSPRLPAPFQPLFRDLCRSEVPAAMARRLLVRWAEADTGIRQRPDRVSLRAALVRSFRVGGQMLPGGDRRVVAMVGATGVGKTTTIAKLAGQSRHTGGLRVALVNLDTYRIGALAQMQIYADLLGVPLHVARNPAELVAALQASREADLVLVDSTGRSPSHRQGIAAIRACLRAIPGVEVHLVVSATTKGSDLEETLLRFKPLGYHSLLITKLDEVRSVGPLLGLALDRDLPISYLTTGQEVPDDLEAATLQGLASLLLPEDAAASSGRCGRA
jgi:flagellar biosynthesis protein FlhF